MKHLVLPDGVRLSLHDAGQGHPLLMLHGWSQSAAMFRYQIEQFSSVTRVIAPDLRGHGLSDKPAFGYRVASLARDVNHLLDQLGVDSADMLGWSMGASVLWSFIDLFGSRRIRKLVLVDEPACVVQLPGMNANEIVEAGAIFDLAGLQGLIAGLLGPESLAVRRAFLDGMLSKHPNEETRQWLMSESLKMPPTCAAALLLDHATQDWRDLIPRIDVPTLVVGGESSHVNPLSQKWIASRIRSSRLAIISAQERGSHFPFIENPTLFNRLVGEFLGF
jgi:pimeloyl-ACP methyl ester carboxylesterase